MENLQSKGVLQKYYQRLGTETGYSARYNLEFFKRFGFKFRIIDSQEASTEITLFGKIFKTPIFSSALSGMQDITENALTKLAIGMRDAGSMMWLGIASSQQVRSVLETGVPTVRIVKPYKDILKMIKELKEAEAGGALAVGCDIVFSYGGKRGDLCYAPEAMGPKTVAELKQLSCATRLPFILKGILSQEDAKKSLEIGAGGIVISNHGAGIIDYSAHPLEVLPEIKEIIKDRIPIFVDSGFQRGTDALKALALGADAVLMGTTLIVGLAADGSAGVTEMVNILTSELKRAMSVTGCKDLSNTNRDILVDRGFEI